LTGALGFVVVAQPDASSAPLIATTVPRMQCCMVEPFTEFP
jgi:hypothetical protein